MKDYELHKKIAKIVNHNRTQSTEIISGLTALFQSLPKSFLVQKQKMITKLIEYECMKFGLLTKRLIVTEIKGGDLITDIEQGNLRIREDVSVLGKKVILNYTLHDSTLESFIQKIFI